VGSIITEAFAIERIPPISDEKVLVVAGGKLPSDAWLKTISKQFDVWVADKGIQCCRNIDVVPVAMWVMETAPLWRIGIGLQKEGRRFIDIPRIRIIPICN